MVGQRPPALLFEKSGRPGCGDNLGDVGCVHTSFAMSSNPFQSILIKHLTNLIGIDAQFRFWSCADEQAPSLRAARTCVEEILCNFGSSNCNNVMRSLMTRRVQRQFDMTVSQGGTGKKKKKKKPSNKLNKNANAVHLCPIPTTAFRKLERSVPGPKGRVCIPFEVRFKKGIGSAGVSQCTRTFDGRTYTCGRVLC